jgi:dipeptidyl aminopeptidase/acylaminoacyl peptidase
VLRACRVVVAVALILVLTPFARAQSSHATAGAPAVVGLSNHAQGTPAQPSVEQFFTAAWPIELVAAKKAERIAWLSYDRGERNVYTAAAPDFRAVRVTPFKGDNGIDLTTLRMSDDGAIVVFVRGHTPNRDGWIANPTSDPNGAERAIWAAPTTGGTAWRLAAGTDPALSPDGRFVAFANEGQIYRVAVSGPSTPIGVRKVGSNAADKPLIKAWGTNGNPVWSPDSSKIAFVSSRVDHSYVAVYDVRKRTVTYLAPGVDRDTSPTWSADGKRVAFIRRPGLPFGQMPQPTSGGAPQGAPAAQGRGRGAAATQGRGAGQGGQRGAQQSGPIDGLMRAAFAGGYTLSFWVADAATGEGREFWHNQPDDRAFANITAIEWAGDHVIFQQEPEEWIRYYAVAVAGQTTPPVVLTPGEGMVEDVALSSDGRTLFYCTNAGDIDGRHIWKVPTAGGDAVQITSGAEIDTYPAALASGTRVAMLRATWNRPQSVAVVAAGGGPAKVIFPTLPKEFPTAAHVVPTNVLTKADDGLEIHNQLFLPKDLKPGERRPAVVFVHGGPQRQMVLGYHYRFFYHLAYGVNQWLANQGYVVISVNYRSGIGYGKSFRMAPNTGGRGNSEYQDVVAAAKYLQARPDVDPQRIGIWGLSYGGLLTAQALAHNSDIFKVGVDLAGVHLQGSSLDPESVSYQSSAIAQIDKWKSPVLLRHGDDDRNVPFSQTVGLVQLLRAHNVYYELIVYPDDVHDPLLHRRWVYELTRTCEFLNRYLKGAKTTDQ